MRNVHRFASLKGQCQRYVDGIEPTYETAEPSLPADDEPPRAEWPAVKSSRGSLATLGDLLAHRSRASRAAVTPRRAGA